MYGASFELDPVDDVPMDEQERAVDISLEIQQEDRKNARALTKTMQDLSGEYQKEVYSLVGTANLESYREFHSSLRKQMREAISKAPPTAAGEEEIGELRRKAVRDSRRYLKKIGFDMARASEVREEYHTRLREAVSKALGRPEEPKYAERVLPEDVHNPSPSFVPPYAGQAGQIYAESEGSAAVQAVECFLDRGSGQVGSRSSIGVSAAEYSDIWEDESLVQCRHGMRFWYKMPATGHVRASLKLRCIYTSHLGSFRGEAGSASFAQYCHVYLRVLYPTSGKVILGPSLLFYERSITTNTDWYENVGDPGDLFGAEVTSPDPHAAGTFLVLEVGTRDVNWFLSNNMRVSSRLWMKWNLVDIAVQSVAA